MCKKKCRVFIVILAAVTVIAAAVGYFRFISSMIYEESTSHLKEIYTQANKVYSRAMSDKWNNISDWLPYLEKSSSDHEMYSYIYGRKQEWGFKDFYFISRNGEYITADGIKGDTGLGSSLTLLIEERRRVVSSSALAEYPELTLFAVPSFIGSYRGFEFEAIGISINNRRISESLEISAFEGRSESYVVDLDGRVILDSLANKEDAAELDLNLISWLQTSTDMGIEEIDILTKKIKNHEEADAKFALNGEEYYLVCEPADYAEWSVIGIVPSDVVSAGMNKIQAVTIPVVVALAVFIFGILIWFIAGESRKNLAAKDTEILYREKLFGLLTHNVDDVFFMVDAEDFKVGYVSPNVERLLGLREEDVRNNIRIVDELAAEPATVRILDKLPEIGLGEQKQYEREYIHNKTGDCRWFLATAYHADISGEEKYVVVLSDRTKERRMNQTLTHALQVAKSANEAKSNFLANMSHDIRTPMNAIVGFSSLLRKNAHNPDKVDEYAKKIASSGQHLLNIINDVLDMSKIESGRTSLNPTEFSLEEMLKEIYTIALPQTRMKKLNFEVRSRSRFPERLIGDRLRINQILLNLLSNGIKYTDEGGYIILTAEGWQEDERNMAHIRFTVADNGCGMNEEFLSKLFEPFAREANDKIREIQGTGLGMAITKNIVELMGGSISVESAPEQGSTFYVDLELETVPDKQDEDFWTKRGITRMLVVDDKEEICLDVRDIMSGTGVEVDCAIGGKEAVRMAAAAAQIHEDYHVIMIDWKMHDMDGIETAKKIRERIKEPFPVMLLTAYDFEGIGEEATDAGISAFIHKPFFIAGLRRAIREGDMTEKAKEEGTCKKEENLEFDGVRVLAAEDNEPNAEILTELLKAEGIVCDIAQNGKEAVERFTKSESGFYDLIFMDIAMPVMDGYEAAEYIRSSAHPDALSIPIVAMTAYVFEEDVKRSLASGMNAHTAKPIEMEKIKMLMRQLIRKERINE